MGARQRAETVVNICDGRAPARRNGIEYLGLGLRQRAETLMIF